MNLGDLRTANGRGVWGGGQLASLVLEGKRCVNQVRSEARNVVTKSPSLFYIWRYHGRRGESPLRREIVTNIVKLFGEKRVTEGEKTRCISPKVRYHRFAVLKGVFWLGRILRRRGWPLYRYELGECKRVGHCARTPYNEWRHSIFYGNTWFRLNHSAP